MAQVIVRNIDDAVKSGLKARASLHRWSMEKKVRQILRHDVSAPAQTRAKIGNRIAARFVGMGLTKTLHSFLAAGQRKSILEQRFGELLQDDLQNCVLFFDINSASHAAQLTAYRKAHGQSVG